MLGKAATNMETPLRETVQHMAFADRAEWVFESSRQRWADCSSGSGTKGFHVPWNWYCTSLDLTTLLTIAAAWVDATCILLL
jgi:hypothetical protein